MINKHCNTYSMPARCDNCGWAGPVEIQRGHKFNQQRVPCPNCACSSLDLDRLPSLPITPLPRLPWEPPWERTQPWVGPRDYENHVNPYPRPFTESMKTTGLGSHGVDTIAPRGTVAYHG